MSAVPSQLSQGAESVREYAQSNPAKFAGLLSAGISLCAGGFAYWYLKARPHPSTIAVDLPFHHFNGHVPAMKAANAQDEWLKIQAELLNREEVKKAGLATLCLPNVLFPYLHYIVDPDLIKFLWTDAGLPKGERRNDCFRELFDNTIFLSSMEQWKWHRQIIGKMFSLHNLRDFMFNCSVSGSQRTIDMIKSLMMMIEKDVITQKNNVRSVTVDLFDILGRFTMDAFVEISFGRHGGSVESYPEPCEFGKAFDRAFFHGTVRYRDPFWKVKKYLQTEKEAKMTQDMHVIYEYMDNLLNMDSRRELFDETGVDKHDVMSLYLSEDPDVPPKVLRNVAISMIMAGRDTTRGLLAWCLALLCTSEQKWLQKVRDEINGIDTQELRYEDAKKRMPLTESVLLETLRLWPSVTSSTRCVDRDLCLPNGLKLLKGDLVSISHFAQGRNTLIYGEDASKFTPLRWIENGIHSYKPQEFGAFNQYPRMCLGREFALTEAKVFLFYFLKAFDYRSVGDKFPTAVDSTMLMMKEGWQVQITEKQA